MITIKPTEHYTGVTVQGDYQDFDTLVDAIYRITTDADDLDDRFYAVKIRLLGLCYDIRHAAQGDREVVLVDNNYDKYKQEYHGIKAKDKNIYYSVNILFPDAIFIAAATPKLYKDAKKHYGKTKKDESIRTFDYSYYIKDCAYLDMFCSQVWSALGEVVGDKTIQNMMNYYNRAKENYYRYVGQYIDELNDMIIKSFEPYIINDLKDTTYRILKKHDDYLDFEYICKRYAKEYDTHINNLQFEYDSFENIEW